MDTTRYIEASSTLRSPVLQAVLGANPAEWSGVPTGWVRPSGWPARYAFAGTEYGLCFHIRAYPRTGSNSLSLRTATSTGAGWYCRVDSDAPTSLASGALTTVSFAAQPEETEGETHTISVYATGGTVYPLTTVFDELVTAQGSMAFDVLEIQVKLPDTAFASGSLVIRDDADMVRASSVYVESGAMVGAGSTPNWKPLMHPADAFESLSSVSHGVMQRIVSQEGFSPSDRRDVQLFKAASVGGASEGDYSYAIQHNNARLDTFWVDGDFTPAISSIVAQGYVYPLLRQIHIGSLPNMEGSGGLNSTAGMLLSPCPSLTYLHIGSAPKVSGFASVLNGADVASVTHLVLPTDHTVWGEYDFSLQWSLQDTPYDLTYPTKPFVPANPAGAPAVAYSTVRLHNLRYLRSLVAPTWGHLGTSGVIGGCPDLEHVDIKICYNTTLYVTSCPRLTYLNMDYASMSWLTGVVLRDLGLSGAELDRIFTALPTVGYGEIYVQRVAGQASCSISIAQAKGYYVELLG